MIALTSEQRLAIATGAAALERHATIEAQPEALRLQQIGYVATMRDILRTAEDAPTPDAPPLWRDSDRRGWMHEGAIRLELVDAPYPTVGISRGGSVLIDDDSETVMIPPEHLPALIAMLTASTLYNRSHPCAARPVLRRMDEAAIFLMIAGPADGIWVLLINGMTSILGGVAALAWLWRERVVP